MHPVQLSGDKVNHHALNVPLRDQPSAVAVSALGGGNINIVAKQGRGWASRITGQILNSATGQPFAEDDLWSLVPGTAAAGGTDALWFTAGINSESDGLLGYFAPSSSAWAGIPWFRPIAKLHLWHAQSPGA